MDRTCFHCLLDKWKMEVGREREIEQVGDEGEKGDRETETEGGGGGEEEVRREGQGDRERKRNGKTDGAFVKILESLDIFFPL